MTAGCRVYRLAHGEVCSRRGRLTTDHPRSNYGLPVLVLDGRAYGPGDLAGAVLLCDDHALTTGAALAAGFDCAVSTDDAAARLRGAR